MGLNGRISRYFDVALPAFEVLRALRCILRFAERFSLMKLLPIELSSPYYLLSSSILLKV